MLIDSEKSMQSYLWAIPHGDFRVETRPKARTTRMDKFSQVPAFRFLLALYLIAKDDAYLRPVKPNLSKPMFYRHFIWKVHNCGQRKDGTFYTAGNASLMIFNNSEIVYDSTIDEVPFHELKSRFGTHG